MKRIGEAVWQGTIKEGTGILSTQSTVLDATQYSFNSRFADGIGTNPEELLAAAHAGCFAMSVSAQLTMAGFNPKSLKAHTEITLTGTVITLSEITLKAEVEGITQEKFDELIELAKEACTISNALKIEILVKAELI